jgi:hypothetical protein
MHRRIRTFVEVIRRRLAHEYCARARRRPADKTHAVYLRVTGECRSVVLDYLRVREVFWVPWASRRRQDAAVT